MTLDEAIRVNTVLKGAPVLKDNPKVIEALNLNIEALKEVKHTRSISVGLVKPLLPGETQD